MVYDVKSDLIITPDFIKDYPDTIEEIGPCFPSVFLVPGCSPHSLSIMTIYTFLRLVTQSIDCLTMR